MHHTFSIADLRAELGLTLEQFGHEIGIASKGNVSIIERTGRCSLSVAMKLEDLSGGRIKAHALNDEVALVRAAPALCTVCAHRLDDRSIRACAVRECAHAHKDAA